MSIKLKMALSIIGALLILLFSNSVSFWLINETNKTISLVINENGKKLELLSGLKTAGSQREVYLLDLVILDPDGDGYEEQLVALKKKLKGTAEDISGKFNQLNKMKFEEKELALYEEVKDSMNSANNSFASFMTAIDEGFNDEALIIMNEEFRPEFKAFSELVIQIQKHEKEMNDHAIEVLFKEAEIGTKLLIASLVISVIVFVIGGIIASRNLMKPINAMQETMAKISETGELKHRIPIFANDELGRTSDSVNGLLSDISSAVDGVNAVLKDISKGHFENEVKVELRGDFLSMKNEVNHSVSQIRSVIDMLQATATNFRAGKLSVEKNESVDLQGKFSDVVYDLDRSALRMKQTVDSISNTLKYLADGDFSVRSETDARGDFIPLKESLNVTLADLENFVDEVAKVQASISEGDLTQQVEGVYAGKMAVLKDSLNSSVHNTAVMVAKVETIANSVVSGVQNMAQGNSDITARIQQQAAALEETSSSMEEMTVTVRQNAGNAHLAKDKTEEAAGQIESSRQTMEKALDSMDQMSDASQKINEITTLIDGIAFQTNLLALNAAVEAARAGEHGRGFAVVAGEVRSLAQKSAEAAGEIKSLIENSVQISEQSGQFVRQMSDALNQINESMVDVNKMVSEISSTSAEQANGVEQVNSAVSSMDQLTQRNAEIVADVSKSNDKLLDESDILKQQVKAFTVDINPKD